jgi:hypothetical protein
MQFSRKITLISFTILAALPLKKLKKLTGVAYICDFKLRSTHSEQKFQSAQDLFIFGPNVTLSRPFPPPPSPHVRGVSVYLQFCRNVSVQKYTAKQKAITHFRQKVSKSTILFN